MTINEIQEIQFELLRKTVWVVDGNKIANDLLANRDLWEGMLWGKWGYFDLIPLRDISQGIWNADTMYLLTKEEHVKKIKKLAKKWGASEFDYATRKHDSIQNCVPEGMGATEKRLGHIPFPQGAAVIRLWWD